MPNQSAAQRMIRLYCSFQFFFSLLLWLPIFYEFQKRIGLNDSQIFSIQSIYYLTFCLLELPTGWLADSFGSLICLRLGAWTLVISNLLPVFFLSYLGMLFHFLLIALSRSLISGAASAYLYDYLKDHGDSHLYKKAEGDARFYGLIGKVLLWVWIGSAMQWHLTLPYSLTALSAFISVYFAYRLPERKQITKRVHPELAIRIKRMASEIRSHSRLALLMLQGIGVFVLGRILQVNLFQPILAAKSFSIATFGFVMSAMTVFEALGSALPHWMRNRLKIKDLSAVSFLTVAMSVSIASIPFLGKTGTSVALAIFSVAAGISYPIQRQLMNDAITRSEDRATLLSSESILDRSACSLVALALGPALQAGYLNRFLIFSGTATSLAVIGLTWLLIRDKSYRRVVQGAFPESQSS